MSFNAVVLWPTKWIKLLLHPPMEQDLISYNSLSSVSLNIMIVNSMNRAFVW